MQNFGAGRSHTECSRRFAMPRASWRGFLRLSLVTCPVYLSPATTRTKPIRLHQVWQPAPVEVNEDELPDRSAAQQGSASSARRLPAENGSPDADQSRAATRIALRPHDPGTGEEIDKREVVKGYEYGRGQFVTFTPRGIEGARCRKLEGDRSREVCAVERPGSGLFRQLVLPLSGRPGRGRNAAGDRRGNGRSWSRRTRATYGP